MCDVGSIQLQLHTRPIHLINTALNSALRAYGPGRESAEIMMEADWDEVSRIAVPPPSPHVLPTIATAIAFDDLQELLWAGNEYVSIRCLNAPYTKC